MRTFGLGPALFEGRRKRISPHLGRAPDEPVDGTISQLYDRLLAVLRRPAVRNGQWQLLECIPAWEGNWTADCVVAFVWSGPPGERLLAAVNFAPNQSQCRVRLPFAELAEGPWRLTDRLNSDVFDCDGHEWNSAGLYLDMRLWQATVYTLNRIAP